MSAADNSLQACASDADCPTSLFCYVSKAVCIPVSYEACPESIVWKFDDRTQSLVRGCYPPIGSTILSSSTNTYNAVPGGDGSSGFFQGWIEWLQGMVPVDGETALEDLVLVSLGVILVALFIVLLYALFSDSQSAARKKSPAQFTPQNLPKRTSPPAQPVPRQPQPNTFGVQGQHAMCYNCGSAVCFVPAAPNNINLAQQQFVGPVPGPSVIPSAPPRYNPNN